MNITVYLFAALKEQARQDRLTVEIPDSTATVGSLKARLAAEIPALAPLLSRSLAAINREFAFDEDHLHAGDEVALFPPVSGGCSPLAAEPIIMVKLTNEPLDVDACLQAITRPTTGAVCAFVGTVRELTAAPGGENQPRQTIYLEYEAYRPMAEAKLTQIAAEIHSRWPNVEGIALVHRLGRLKAGTPSIIAACSAAHRTDGIFEAVRYAIDRVKEIVPIWKKDFGPQGDVWVAEECRPEARMEKQ